MRKTITVSLPGGLQGELDDMVRAEGVSRSEVVREALRDYLWKREFDALRRKMVAKAQAEGIFTDEDVFERFG